jgi:hypothetical protein
LYKKSPAKRERGWAAIPLPRASSLPRSTVVRTRTVSAGLVAPKSAHTRLSLRGSQLAGRSVQRDLTERGAACCCHVRGTRRGSSRFRTEKKVLEIVRFNQLLLELRRSVRTIQIAKQQQQYSVSSTSTATVPQHHHVRRPVPGCCWLGSPMPRSHEPQLPLKSLGGPAVALTGRKRGIWRLCKILVTASCVHGLNRDPLSSPAR